MEKPKKKQMKRYHALPEDEKSILEINRLSERYLGCMLLITEGDHVLAEDDYRDELEYIYENPPEIGEQEKEQDLFHTGELPAELQDFLETLMPEQKEALYAILTSDVPQAELERISQEIMTMPEILVDDINAMSMEILGDIIIDTMGEKPVVAEEYFDSLKRSVM